MPYDVLSDEQREIRELVRTLARERIASRAAEIDKKAEFPWDMVELFREHELCGIMFDEQYGGHGASALTTLVAVAVVFRFLYHADFGLINRALMSIGSLGGICSFAGTAAIGHAHP